MTTWAERDAQYRAALGVPDGDPLPNAIGQVRGHARNPRHFTPGWREPAVPPGTSLATCDRTLRSRRAAISKRAVPEGDVDTQLREYAEGIERAEFTRDTARDAKTWHAAAVYVTRLKSQRDTLIQLASVG